MGKNKKQSNVNASTANKNKTFHKQSFGKKRNSAVVFD